MGRPPGQDVRDRGGRRRAARSGRTSPTTSPTSAFRPRATARGARSPSSSSSRGTCAPRSSPRRRGRTRRRSARTRGAHTRRSGSRPPTPARARSAPSARSRTRRPAAYAFLGLDASWNPTRDFVDIAARGMLREVLGGPESVPLRAERERRLPAIHGRRRRGRPRRARFRPRAARSGCARRSASCPSAFAYTYGGDRAGPELVSRLLRFNYKLKDGLFLSVDAPMEVNWLKPRVEWTFGVGLVYAPASSRLSKDRGLLLSKETLAVRQDDAWVPPPAPYGHLQGRKRLVVRRRGRDRRRAARERRRGAQLRARPPRRRDRVGPQPLGRPVRVGPGRVARRRPPGDLRRVEVPHGHVRRRAVRWYALKVLGLVADAGEGRVRAEGPRGSRKSTRRRASTGRRAASTTSRPARASASCSTPGSSTSSSRARRSRGTPLPSRRRRSSASGSASAWTDGSLRGRMPA